MLRGQNLPSRVIQPLEVTYRNLREDWPQWPYVSRILPAAFLGRLKRVKDWLLMPPREGSQRTKLLMLVAFGRGNVTPLGWAVKWRRRCWRVGGQDRRLEVQQMDEFGVMAGQSWKDTQIVAEKATITLLWVERVGMKIWDFGCLFSAMWPGWC